MGASAETDPRTDPRLGSSGERRGSGDLEYPAPADNRQGEQYDHDQNQQT